MQQIVLVITFSFFLILRNHVSQFLLWTSLLIAFDKLIPTGRYILHSSMWDRGHSECFCMGHHYSTYFTSIRTKVTSTRQKRCHLLVLRKVSKMLWSLVSGMYVLNEYYQYFEKTFFITFLQKPFSVYMQVHYSALLKSGKNSEYFGLLRF